jgi:hypothetical protein
MTCGLIEAYAITGFFFDQQKLPAAFNDGGNGDRGFPEVGHDYFQSPSVRRPGILLLPITGLLWFALVLVSLDWAESIDSCAVSCEVSAECTAFHQNYLPNRKTFLLMDPSSTRK